MYPGFRFHPLDINLLSPCNLLGRYSLIPIFQIRKLKLSLSNVSKATQLKSRRARALIQAVCCLSSCLYHNDNNNI